MIENKNRDLAITASSKIFEKVNTALSKPNTDKRWFWELLQNAKDTVVRSKGKVDIRLILSKNEANEPYVRFEHNGNPFKTSNHPLKLNDLKTLLLADSGKIEEDETEKEDITGQFGTGFLSTHILSLKILVEGIFLDAKGNYNSFSFELDREYKNKFELIEKVEKSLEQYDSNFKPIVEPLRPFLTKFTYFLNYNKVNLETGIETVETGIDGINHFIPFVLAFCKEINSVEIVDELTNNNTTCFSRESDLEKEDSKIQIVKINKKVSGNSQNETYPDSVEIALYSNLNNHIDIAIELEKNNSTYKIKQIETNLPVLFCTFPLIGSEAWRFPTMINCTKFVPQTERDGILLLTGKDSGNQNLVEESIAFHKDLVEHAIREKWEDLYLLAQTSYKNCPDWASEDWYKGVFKAIRKNLLEQKVVVKENGEYILLKDTLFPFHNAKDKLEEFWNICNEFNGDYIPQKRDMSAWNKIINVDYASWDVDLKYDIDRLLSDVEIHNSLGLLAEKKFDNDESIAIDWLNKVIDFVKVQSGKPELLKNCKIIPNQFGDFKVLDEHFHFDDGISDSLKHVLDSFEDDKWSFKIKLIDKRIKGLEKHSPLSTKDISFSINELIEILTKNSLLNDENDKNGRYRNVFYQLISFSPDENTSEQKTLYDFARTLLQEDLVPEVSIVENLSDFDFAACNEWIIKTLLEQVSKRTSFEGLKSHNAIFESKNDDELINWIDDFIIFITKFEKGKHKSLLDSFAIIPNQNLDFCLLKGIKKDDNIPTDLVSIAETPHINYFWKVELLYKKLSETEKIFEEDGTIKLEIVAAQINAAIRDYDGNKQNKKFAQLIFLLNNSETVNNPKYKKLFSDFHSNRDSLIVGTLGEGEALENVARLIQNPDKLAILVNLADNKKITNAQLEELTDILTADKISIASIIEIAKGNTNQSISNLIRFEGFDISDNEKEESIWKKIAMFFIETLKEARIETVEDYLHLIQGIKNSDILVRSDRFKLRFNNIEGEEFNKVQFKAEITKNAIDAVLKHLNEKGYEILEPDNEYYTIWRVNFNDKKDFKIVIRPSNSEHYHLYSYEKKVLKNSDAELWLSDGVSVQQETFYTLLKRITAFIPLEDFIPGKSLR